MKDTDPHDPEEQELSPPLLPPVPLRLKEPSRVSAWYNAGELAGKLIWRMRKGLTVVACIALFWFFSWSSTEREKARSEAAARHSVEMEQAIANKEIVIGMTSD